MKLVKMRQDTAESERVSLMEQDGSSKTSRLLNPARMLSSWRGRIWPLLLVVLLLIAIIPYLRVIVATSRHGLSPSTGVPLVLFPIVGASAIALFSLLRPIWALAGFFAVTPLANSFVAWVTSGDPALYGKAGMFGVELMFLSLATGLLLGRVIWPDPVGSKRVETGVAFYALAVLASMTLFYLQDPWWWDRLILAWRHIPSGRQLSPNHPFRAGLLILASLLCYRLTLNQLKTSKVIRLVCRGWLVGALLTGIHGFSVWKWGQYNQFASLLDDVNSYGSYLALTLFIAWGEWLTEREPWARVLSGLTLLLTAWMIPIAGSRIAIIAASAGAGIALTILSRSMRGRWIRGSVLATLVSGLLLYYFMGGYALVQKTLPDSGVLSIGMHRVAQAMDARLVLNVWQGDRQGLVAAGIRMVEESPALGLGPGTAYRELGRGYYRPGDKRYIYRPGDKRYIEPRLHSNRRENLHNYFVQVAAETGLLGLAGFLWAVLAVVIRGFFRDLGQDWHLARLFSIGVGSYLITAFTSHPLILSKQAFLFWGGLGVLAACSRRGHASSSGRSCSSQE